MLGEKDEIDYSFPNLHVLDSSHNLIPLFSDFLNYMDTDIVPSDLSFHLRKKFMHEEEKFFWDETYLYRSFDYGLICRCVPEVQMLSVFKACHSSPVGEHYNCTRTARNILQCGYYWPTIHQHAHEFTKSCDRCQDIEEFQKSKSSLEIPL